MHIDRTTDILTVSAASPAPSLTLSDQLCRKSSSRWAKSTGEGAVVMAATALACLLSIFLVETAFMQSIGVIAA